MPRNRSARLAVLGSSPRRTASSAYPSRSSSALRRRLVAAVLVVVALALVTLSFRGAGSGGVHGVQDVGASVLRPFEVAAERVARPFRDLAGWVDGLVDAKGENEELRGEVDRLRQQLIQTENAIAENERLRTLLAYRDSPRFPGDFRGVAAHVISRPLPGFQQRVVIAAGTRDGVEVHDPVVTADGLVGQVTRAGRRVAQVTLLTDEASAVSAAVLGTGASGIVRHGQPSEPTLVLDRVTKDQVVSRGDVVVTAGWRSGNLSSIYPRGIPIGRVTSVGQIDTDLYKQVQVEPFVDFGAVDAVLVLVAKDR